MENVNTPNTFPEQDEPSKLHGTNDHSGQKEKYMRDSGKIEDLPPTGEVAKMNSAEESTDKSDHLTDRTGEEKNEDYINTDERKNDIQGKKNKNF